MCDFLFVLFVVIVLKCTVVNYVHYYFLYTLILCLLLICLLLVLCLGWNVRLIVSLPRRYGVMTLRYNRRTASQPSHVVRQNLQKGKLRVLNPARIHVFYWFNWLNLIGS